jgi:predicted MFS family arabinose efflux permease
MALVASGVTLANVIGVPLGTAVGQQLGWRLTYLVVGALGLLTVAAIARLVPDLQQGEANLRDELRAFARAQVWLTLTITVLGFSGMFTVLSYISPILVEVARYPQSAVPWLLVVFGLAPPPATCSAAGSPCSGWWSRSSPIDSTVAAGCPSRRRSSPQRSRRSPWQRHDDDLSGGEGVQQRAGVQLVGHEQVSGVVESQVVGESVGAQRG